MAWREMTRRLREGRTSRRLAVVGFDDAAEFFLAEHWAAKAVNSGPSRRLAVVRLDDPAESFLAPHLTDGLRLEVFIKDLVAYVETWMWPTYDNVAT